MNKKFVYQVGNNKKLYYDAQPTRYQDFYVLGLMNFFDQNINKLLTVLPSMF